MGIYQNVDKNVIKEVIFNARGKSLNEKQRMLAEDITTPTISFSDPGTGKTETMIKALVVAELVHGIPAQNIVAVSFTRAAKGELKGRHQKLCKELSIGSRIHFKTFMGYCLEIIKDNYKLFGWRDFRKCQSEMSNDDAFDYIQSNCNYYNIDIDESKYLKIYRAINALNSSLVMDENHIVTRVNFKQLGISVEQFQFLRKAVYDSGRFDGSITVKDILLFTLELLLKNPELSEKYRKQNRILLVDEFQDMSVLQLLLCYLLSDNLIAIGDMNQQIYSFNGACGEIVAKYKELYPNAKEIRLDQSYRCAQEIADYAYDVVKYNGMLESPFKGVTTGGIVNVQRGIDFEQVARKFKEEMDNNNGNIISDEMFLCRNNYSIIPLAEYLFQNKIPFRINIKNDRESGFPRADKMEAISDYCHILELFRMPYQSSCTWALYKIWPEFVNYTKNNPIGKIMDEERCSFLEACELYKFKDVETAKHIINILTEIDEMYLEDATVMEMIEVLRPLMEVNWFKKRIFRMNETPEYWLKMAAPVLDKPYGKFIAEEKEKDAWAVLWAAKDMGLKLYTLHGSKGLEADTVTILSANYGTIPNVKRLKTTLDYKCWIDAAETVRNERSLCYVGITRAKRVVNIIYDDDIAPMINRENTYQKLDEIYAANLSKFDDISGFRRFIDADIKDLVERI